MEECVRSLVMGDGRCARRRIIPLLKKEGLEEVKDGESRFGDRSNRLFGRLTSLPNLQELQEERK